jgi:hypothetical protein
MIDNALYYPNINFHNTSWLKSMAMFYDKIYRIIPNDIIPEDNYDLQPLLEDTSIGRPIDPLNYSKKTSEEFLLKKDEWDAAALLSNYDEDEQFERIHQDKTDYAVRELFKKLGYQETEEWLYVPTELASNYMLFLAKEIAKKNQLQLITNTWAPWTATTYFNMNGNIDESITPYDLESKYFTDPFSLYSLILNEITPLNISEIPSHKIIQFREKRKDEIKNFRHTILELYNELQILDDPFVREDKIKDKIKEFQIAQKNYQDSADIIKAKGWFGVSFMGFPAPIALGKLFSIPYASTVALATTGLAIGGLFNIKNTKHELQKLQKENPISALVEMKKSFKNYSSLRGQKDINYKAYTTMEEYVND